MTTETTGARIKRLREERNLKVGQLAKASATSAGYLYRIENSGKDTKLGAKVRQRIADALGVDPGEIAA